MARNCLKSIWQAALAVVEHSVIVKPKVQGLNPTTSTGKEEMAKKVFNVLINFRSEKLRAHEIVHLPTGKFKLLFHGQTSANRTKPGPSFQLQKRSFASRGFKVLSVKLLNLKLNTRPKQLLGFLPQILRSLTLHNIMEQIA